MKEDSSSFPTLIAEKLHNLPLILMDHLFSFNLDAHQVQVEGIVQRLPDDIFREVLYNSPCNRQLTMLLSNREQSVFDKDILIKMRGKCCPIS